MKNGIRTFECIGCKKEVVKSCTKSVKFCSRSCYQSNKGNLGLMPKKGKEIKCKQCGKNKYIPISQIKKENYCSPICHNKSQSKKVSIMCIVCHNEKMVSPIFSDRKYCSIKCRDNCSEFTKGLINMNLIQQIGKTTNIEKIGYAKLEENNIEYERQKLMFDKFCVDAYLPKTKTVIQFDGDYWHGNTNNKKPLDKRQIKRMSLDKSQDAYMKKAGIKVIRIWGSELLKNPNILIEQILRKRS